MDELRREITAIDRKVDLLHELVLKLDRQMSELLEGERGENCKPSEMGAIFPERPPVDPLMQHKDILLDGSEWENVAENDAYNGVSPELQIRRLTAQVTAAYSRIATLEEQLLARRESSQKTVRSHL